MTETFEYTCPLNLVHLLTHHYPGDQKKSASVRLSSPITIKHHQRPRFQKKKPPHLSHRKPASRRPQYIYPSISASILPTPSHHQQGHQELEKRFPACISRIRTSLHPPKHPYHTPRSTTTIPTARTFQAYVCHTVGELGITG
ncbi:hypothetical protein P171DRAFT_98625 [Karstenula rhodostoma CBS 690.94]|uniref:Uncharacterized protein n=1 Tax=Karstenula rhodostoma CBS 690.94 TaxID=1392251 RepID=A0A9P4P8C6_9PLEO|nr:hypothetical protein P171DRAFT_98625 [Karstenula rhodostoma CBS 690.94]